MVQTKEILKSYFETGDYPTEQQFVDLIDSLTNSEEVLALLNQNLNTTYTYFELKGLVDNNQLIPDKRYILNDYQTEYYISGSNSGPIEVEVAIEQLSSGWAFFNPPLPIVVGDSVEITALPAGYTGTITIGSTTTVTANSEGFFLRFANSMETQIGFKFRYSVPRFKVKTNLNGITLRDTNGKIVLKPDGVINTLVHDGTPYMDMSAVENPSVPVEQIILTAVANNQFSINALSLTHFGDILEYDFNDYEIKNEDNKVIGKRKGSILRRKRVFSRDFPFPSYTIDINKDWRVQRYRRIKLDGVNWDNYILNNAINSSLYNLNGYNACSTSNISITENHKYIIRRIEDEDNLYHDFTKTGTEANVFLTGQATAPEIKDGSRFEFSESEFTQKHIVDNPEFAKDFFIIPFDANQNVNDNRFGSVIIKDLEDTVFLNYGNQYFPDASVIFINAVAASVSNSSFMSSVVLTSNNPDSAITNVISLDYLELVNNGFIVNLNVLATSVIINHGDINMVTVAGAPASAAVNEGDTYIKIRIDQLSSVKDVIIGGKSFTLDLNNAKIRKSLFAFERANYINFSDVFTYLTAMKSKEVLLTLTFNIDLGTFINAKKNVYGYYFDTFTTTQGKKIINNNLGDLLYETFDGNNNNTRQILTLSLSQ